jgi:hypothetical protein
MLQPRNSNTPTMMGITANGRPARQRTGFCDGADADCNYKIPCGCILARSSNSKRAGRDSIAAQKTFQIVHFLAGAGGLAEPAAEFL